MPRKSLVDGIVDHFVDHVVQARSVVGVADIHARPLAHGVESFEHLDLIGTVGVGIGRFGYKGHWWVVLFLQLPSAVREF